MNETTEKKIIVLYHGNCLDGICAAWMAWRKFGDAADYVPVHYGQPAPDVTGRDVYIVDFCYSAEETFAMIEQAAMLVVLDHHKTAEQAMKELSQREYLKPVMFVFDMERSGAGIARDHFQPGLESWLVDYTQDRDLWRFALPDSAAVNALIGTLAPTFEAYEDTHKSLTADDAAILGAGALSYKSMYVSKMIEHARLVTFDGHPNIPLVNVPYVGVSEVVGKLAEVAPFAVGWFQRADGKVAISLRSRGDFDVSAIAQRHGGGGHKNAAGFQLDVPIHTFLTPVVG